MSERDDKQQGRGTSYNNEDKSGSPLPIETKGNYQALSSKDINPASQINQQN